MEETYKRYSIIDGQVVRDDGHPRTVKETAPPIRIEKCVNKAHCFDPATVRVETKAGLRKICETCLHDLLVAGRVKLGELGYHWK